MGCGCGGRSYAPRRSSVAVQRQGHAPATQQARTMHPPEQRQQQTPPHIVQSAALAARRTSLRRQV